MQVISAAWRGSQGGTGIPDWSQRGRICRENPWLREPEPGMIHQLSIEFQTNSARRTNRENQWKVKYRMLIEEDMQTRWSNYGCWIGHHCHRVAKTSQSDRTIYRIPDVKSHQMKEGWFPDQYRKNQNDCQCEGWTIKKVKMLIRVLQNVERIFRLPTTKKGISPSFNLPGIRITLAIIDIFISRTWEKLTIRCITTTCAKHFAWWWPVVNDGSLLNFSFAFGATGWEFGSNLPWIIWVMCHFELLLPYSGFAG